MIEVKHKSDCRMHREPAYPKEVCNCGALEGAVESLIEIYSCSASGRQGAGHCTELSILANEIISLVRVEAVEVIKSNAKCPPDKDSK